MKKTISTILALFTFLIFPSTIVVNASEYRLARFDYNDKLDTVSSIFVQYNTKAFNDVKIKNVEIKIGDILDEIENNFSVSKTNNMSDISTLMKVNQEAGTGVKTKVDDDFIELMKIAVEVSEATRGGFDPTIGPLTDLWQISSQSKYCKPDDFLTYDPQRCFVPNKKEINEKLTLIDYEKIEIDEINKTVYLPLNSMRLDLGAIAKGYAADKVMRYLVKADFNFIIVNLGGNIYHYGENVANLGPVKVTIDNPFDDSWFNKSYFISALGNNQTLVTSGIYERYIEVGGKRYHHLLNPATGYPFDNELILVTIIYDYKEKFASSAFADAFATGVYALGLQDGLAYVESHPELEAIFVTKDKEIHLTSGVVYETEEGLTEDYKIYINDKLIEEEEIKPIKPIEPKENNFDIVLLCTLLFLGLVFTGMFVLADFLTLP